MSKNYEIIEVTKENEDEYIEGIVELEKLVLKKMEQSGKVGQLFITGKEGIQEYIESRDNHVFIAVANVDGKPKVISASYITMGQVDFTYNDVTKYFKCGEEYDKYVRSKYPTKKEYEKAARFAYLKKICAFRYARDVILQELGIMNIEGIHEDERNKILMDIVEQERQDPENQFHEKSEIREKLNKYMTLYMKFVKKDLQGYQDFYWLDMKSLIEKCGRGVSVLEYEQDRKSLLKKHARKTQFDSTVKAYDRILELFKYTIHDMSHCQEVSDYFTANTSITVELDTYITHPDLREKGIARLLVLEGLKKSLKTLLNNPNNKDIFIVSTLHADNLSSKYVSEFFGLRDYLFVNRRSGRDRQVHIHGMKREKVEGYLKEMQEKVAVLYEQDGVEVSDERRKEIIEEQLSYEVSELQRLNGIRIESEHKKFTGYIKVKKSRIQYLEELLNKIPSRKKTNPSGTGAGSDGEDIGDIDNEEVQEL